ncbi:MAG: type VI secretion system baseplate subunit TssG [Ignavibacteriota bacterium]
MIVNFMGLVGPLGALPNYVTELIAARQRAKDHTMLAFFNIFNHRLTSFFFQAWEKNHFIVSYERDHSDPFTAALYSLIGFGTKGIRDRQPVEDEAFIFYSGLYGLIPKIGACARIGAGRLFRYSSRTRSVRRYLAHLGGARPLRVQWSVSRSYHARFRRRSGRRGLGPGIARAPQIGAADAGPLQ